MKNYKLFVFSLLIVSSITFSCKNDANEANTSEAEAVAESTDMAVTYMVDSEASTINWAGSKPTGTHTGTIDIASGMLNTNNGMLESGNITIAMKSITVTDLEAGKGKENLEKHLMGTVEGKEGDFFNVNKYPNAKFEITEVSGSATNPVIKGNLTMKDKTNNVEIPMVATYAGNSMTLKSDTFSIDRTKWDVNYGSKSIFDDLGDKFIDDDIELTLSIVANKQ